jgi:hypothetical protein
VVAATAAAGLVALVGAARAAAARHDLDAGRRELVAAREALVERRDADARAALARAERRFVRARRAAGSFPLGTAGPVPVLGSPGRALAGAARAGLELVAAGRAVADVAGELPTAGRAGLEGHDLSAFHAAAVASERALDEARDRVARARSLVAGPAGALLPAVSGPARGVARELDDAARHLDAARRGLELLAGLTGPGTEARILVLSQDSMELRPTGGFIGSFGVLHVAGGRARLERYESFEDLPPPDPPMTPPPLLAEALPRWWGISNVNWWPDFPTTAAVAREMFRRQGGGTVDAVVAITEDALARLVGAIGPVTVPGYAEPVTEAGFAQRVLWEVELKRPQDTPRKRFLIELSRIVFDRLLSLPATDVPAVARAVAASVGAGDLQVWFADPRRQRLIAGSAWSGSLPAPGGDFLQLAEANLSAGKANAELVRTVSYTVRRAGRRLVARLEVSYRNAGARSPVNPYYSGLLRVYVPRGARLLDTSGGQMDLGPAPDGPYRVFARWVFVAPLGHQDVAFDYLLPPEVVRGRHYRLQVVRQPGTPRDTYTVAAAGRHATLAPGQRSLGLRVAVRSSPVVEFLRSRRLLAPLFS